MKKNIWLVMVLAGFLVLGGNALAERPPGVGGGGGGGGGGGEITDYGDLLILYRDADGVPYPSEQILVPDPENPDLDVQGGLCWQPLAFNTDDETLCPESCLAPGSFPAGEVVVDVDQYTCAVAAGCSGCTQEVDFGRVNEARSPDAVFASQLDDVIVKLSIADCLTLDPAGRVVASQVEDDVITSSAIDSPLQNLAIYRQLILMGSLGAPLPLPDADYLVTAARALGAASDKSGGINVDMVAYLNQIMGLDYMTTTLDPKICEIYREEVQGVIQTVEKCFLNYGAFAYNRDSNFGELPDPAYIPEGLPQEGWFEYLAEVDPPTTPPTFEIVQGPITKAVFADEPGFLDGNIDGFAQAADDARAVIDFMHSNPLPAGYETPLYCEASGDIFYDLSISEQSGLQVPKNYVNGGEREFFVNVTNLGPDTAYGTVTVVATNSDGVELGSWEFPITDLLAGRTASFTQYFTITTTSGVINWIATVVPDPPTADPNLGNNTVTARSIVRAAGGGGGGEH